LAVQTEAERDPATEPVSPVLGEAADASASAVGSLRLAQREASLTHQDATIAALERALEAVREAQQAQREQDAQRQRAELRAAYLGLAERQDALRDQATALAEADELNRRQRATLRGFAEPQAAVGTELEALREQVRGQVVFEAMHDRLNRRIGAAVAGLRGGAGAETAKVPAVQASVAAGLRGLGDALIPPPPKNNFAERQPGQQGGGGGGGGGGGAGEVIPDAAQLKLLRSEQAALMAETAAADEPGGDAAVAGVVLDAEQLAERQRELTTLAERLKREMDRQRRTDAEVNDAE
jgi:hypothetical protein